ncbi:MAG: STAS domain-containing protein [Candidatus Latescibacterota bacterium]|nr:MAG: STAS domain-containing protein [Candidatus Latescibacterota bacterium]
MLEIEMRDGELVLAGRFDASQLEKAVPVLESINGSVIADLSRLDYISSAGIGALVKTYKRLRASGHGIKLVNATPHVKNVFHYAGLDRVMGLE